MLLFLIVSMANSKTTNYLINAKTWPKMTEFPVYSSTYSTVCADPVINSKYMLFQNIIKICSGKREVPRSCGLRVNILFLFSWYWQLHISLLNTLFLDEHAPTSTSYTKRGCQPPANLGGQYSEIQPTPSQELVESIIC